MVKLVIEKLPNYNPKVEIVEIKGQGHPDTICNSLVEKSSQALSKYYLNHFKKIMYFNIDKALLIAGTSKPRFGGGEIINPMRIIIAGKATKKVGNIKVPVEEIIKKVVNGLMSEFNVEYGLEIDIKEGSSSLKDCFKRTVPVANDTAVGSAFYPPSSLSELVKKTAEHLVSKEFKKRFKSTGYDIKINGLREGRNITLTIALAFIDRCLKDLEDYRKTKHDIKNYLEKRTNAIININTLDSYEDQSTVYLTVTGLSAEMGDGGCTGNGNLYYGIISSLMPMSNECPFGKNVNHPEKLYQAIANKIAENLVKKAELNKVHVIAMTEIGKPLDSPYIVSIKASGKIDLRQVKEIVDNEFINITKTQQEIIFS
ncbi:MAG: methionine adenosyltransferase [Nanoarchaeota archaeon]|nr:methionine adenosyltransferase [Nanoarchaeota archaeon]